MTTSSTSTSPLGTVTTRLLILSDTHTAPPFPSTDTSHAYRQPLPRADILLHAGDLTMGGQLSEYARMISFLAAAPAELKLVIAGNHDITLDAEYYEKGWQRGRGGKEDVAEAKKMWTGEAAKAAGIVYLEEGTRTFRLRNGANFTV
jgi:3',5'-cyclic AMP phosphodiesterase CpdA